MSLRDKAKIVFVIFGAIFLVTVVGLVVEDRYGSEWFSLLNVAVSAALSAALVLLYFRQSTILQSQKELLEAEINRGVRKQHTETLRERVRKWHGNPDREVSDNPLDQPEKNLPTVGAVSFSSAPSRNEMVFDPGAVEFRVIPGELENDRYLRDLLENHAPDLKQQSEQIDELQNRFKQCRKEFDKNFEYGAISQCGQFHLEPADYLSIWFFEHLIRLERGFVDNFDELQDRMIGDLGGTNPHPDEPIVWIMASATRKSESAVYGARHDQKDIDLKESRSELVEEVEALVAEMIRDIQSNHPIDTVVEAARILDEGAEAIDELEQMLIEYDGKPIYQGECEYLAEAEVG